MGAVAVAPRCFISGPPDRSFRDFPCRRQSYVNAFCSDQFAGGYRWRSVRCRHWPFGRWAGWCVTAPPLTTLTLGQQRRKRPLSCSRPHQAGTITPTAASRASRGSASSKPSIIGVERVLSRSGRLNVSVATPSEIFSISCFSIWMLLPNGGASSSRALRRCSPSVMRAT